MEELETKMEEMHLGKEEEISKNLFPDEREACRKKLLEPKSLAAFDTTLSADCVDFCPISPYEHLLIVGTYQLVTEKEVNEAKKDDAIEEEEEMKERKKANKIGRLFLMSVRGDTGGGTNLNVLDKHDMQGILDARWNRKHTVSGKIILGLVSSIGQLLIYYLSAEGNRLLFLTSINISCGSSLYLDWGTCSEGDETLSVAVSDSEGNITVCKFLQDQLQIDHCFHAHQFEAWVTCFNNRQPAVVYSGGDDNAFQGFDLRSDGTSSPIFTNRNDHGAGVTSILHSSQREEIIYTGSYDELLRVWDNRNMKTPLNKGVHLGGGVWRLRPHPSELSFILCSTMHDGFKIVAIDQPDTPEILLNYTKHKSLAYGADWQHSSCTFQRIASVSFYDHLMTVWQVGF